MGVEPARLRGHGLVPGGVRRAIGRPGRTAGAVCRARLQHLRRAAQRPPRAQRRIAAGVGAARVLSGAARAAAAGAAQRRRPPERRRPAGARLCAGPCGVARTRRRPVGAADRPARRDRAGLAGAPVLAGHRAADRRAGAGHARHRHDRHGLDQPARQLPVLFRLARHRLGGARRPRLAGAAAGEQRHRRIPHRLGLRAGGRAGGAVPAALCAHPRPPHRCRAAGAVPAAAGDARRGRAAAPVRRRDGLVRAAGARGVRRRRALPALQLAAPARRVPRHGGAAAGAGDAHVRRAGGAPAAAAGAAAGGAALRAAGAARWR